jgi:hypothetical protein
LNTSLVALNRIFMSVMQIRRQGYASEARNLAIFILQQVFAEPSLYESLLAMVHDGVLTVLV